MKVSQYSFHVLFFEDASFDCIVPAKYEKGVSWNNEIRKLPQVWALRSGSCYKLGSVESEGVVKEKEVAMLSVYNQSYLALSVGEEVIQLTKKDYHEDGDW